MSVIIHSDDRGWYCLDEQNIASAARWRSYPAIRAHLRKSGIEMDTMGWRHKMLMTDFHQHALDGYPDWTPAGKLVAFVKLEHVRGAGPPSSALCRDWDDVALDDFYQRDWTADGIPIVRAGETYWSGWWFATLAERDRFVAWTAGKT